MCSLFFLNQHNKKNGKPGLITMDKTKFPLCQMKLEKEIFSGNHDEYRISCPKCGTYAISREFYDDFVSKDDMNIVKEEIMNHLQTRKNNHLLPCFAHTCCSEDENVYCIPYQTIRTNTNKQK